MRKFAFWLSLVAFLMSICAVVMAAEIPNDLAVRAVLGEARGDGYDGMSAVAHAIRNRGHLRGVYGKDAAMPDLTPGMWQLASKAWFESEDGADPTRGADHWFSEADLVKLERTRPKWFLRLEPVVKIGGNTFYKRRTD